MASTSYSRPVRGLDTKAKPYVMRQWLLPTCARIYHPGELHELSSTRVRLAWDTGNITNYYRLVRGLGDRCDFIHELLLPRAQI